MPAGPAPHRAYWEALKQLGEEVRFSDPSGRGMMTLLDLHARIEQELKPSYLLIDSRTGVTELGGLATTLLADTVVCMFVAHRESLDGTIAIIDAIKAAPRLKSRGPIRVVPLLSRESDHDSTETRSVTDVERLLEEKGLGLSSLSHDDPVELFKQLFPMTARGAGENH